MGEPVKADVGVTAVIVTYNSADVLEGCLAALPAAMEGVDRWRAVVVDNDSSDGSLGVAERALPDVQCRSTGRNAGYAAAINAGAADLPVDDRLLVLNPDIRMTPGSVARLVHALEASGAGIASPKLVGPDDELAYSQRRDPSLLRVLGEAVLGGGRAGRWSALGELDTDPDHYQSQRWVDWATGAALLISAECRAAVGAWDESFFLYSEETDYCQRARRAGFGVRFVPDAVATHLGGELETSGLLRRHLVRNKLRLYARSHSTAPTLLYRGALILNEASRAARGSAPHRAGLTELLRRKPVAPPTAPARSSDPGFVFFSAQDYWYHNRAHSDIQLARGVARERTVLFVNSLGMRMPVPGQHSDVARRIARKAASVARAVRRPEPETPNLRVMTPLILPFYGSAAIRALNGRLVRGQVSIVARALGMKAPHVLVTIPTAWDVVRGMRKSTLLVNRSDKYSAFPDTDNAVMAQLENQLLGHADAAFFVSHRLMAEERDAVKGRAVFLGHGVDFERFAAAHADAAPEDIGSLPRPRIGFFGGLDDYVVDFDLLKAVADQVPDAQLVLIGDANGPVDDVLTRPNVRWLGRRPYESIPAYGAAFDVAIMPWLQNEWIEHCNPIKAKEYLALGVPVVSTYYPEVDSLRDVIAVARDSTEFIRLIQEALDGNAVGDPAARRNRVRGDSWTARAKSLIDQADRSAR